MTRKKIMYLLSVICVMLVALVGCGSDENETSTHADSEAKQYTYRQFDEQPTGIEGYYVYPENSGKDVADYKEMLKIPEETLLAMTSEQLAQAVVDYPFNSEVLVLSVSSGDGVYGETLRKDCTAYNELLLREDGIDALIDKIEELKESKDSKVLATAETLWRIAMDDSIVKQNASKEEYDRLSNVFDLPL